MFKPTANVLTRFSLFFAMLALAACGGSGSSTTTTVTPVGTPEDTSSGSDDFAGTEVQDYFVGDNAILKAGVFTAEVTYKDERASIVGPMFLSATGNFTFPFGADFITSGTLTLDVSDSVGSDISGPVVEYELINTWNRGAGTIEGFVPSDSNESAILGTGGLVKQIDITRDNTASDARLSFAQIAGIYETTAGSDPQITIDVDGGINGVDRGCILKGQITLPPADINIYELSYEASGCTDLDEATSSERNGTYLGLGTFNSTDESIKFAASNGKIAFYFDGTNMVQ